MSAQGGEQNALLWILETSEDRGVTAVLTALERMGLFRFDRNRDVFVFKQMDVSAEALRHHIDREMKRR